MTELRLKEKHLRRLLKELGGAAVAFSGGVDSAFLLTAASQELGPKAVAVTGRSLSFPERELTAARRFAQERGITHLEVDSEELAVEGFSANPVNRCYLCKKELFSKILGAARKLGLAAVLEASNVDDEGDYRPGLKAIAELGVLSPLRTARLTKGDIRDLSREWGLPTWDKPSFACLASRFPYGETITATGLKKIDEAELFLLSLGLRQARVRCHERGALARIETDEEGFRILTAPKGRRSTAEKLRALGFVYVSLDLLGYRAGSMNETLPLTGGK